MLRPRWNTLICLGVALPLVLGMSCGNVFKTIAIDRPSQDLPITDATLVLKARVGGVFDPATIEVRLDGVDLIAALGLVPPRARDFSLIGSLKLASQTLISHGLLLGAQGLFTPPGVFLDFPAP